MTGLAVPVHECTNQLDYEATNWTCAKLLATLDIGDRRLLACNALDESSVTIQFKEIKSSNKVDLAI